MAPSSAKSVSSWINAMNGKFYRNVLISVSCPQRARLEAELSDLQQSRAKVESMRDAAEEVRLMPPYRRRRHVDEQGLYRTCDMALLDAAPCGGSMCA
jgi:hypothetical protein